MFFLSMLFPFIAVINIRVNFLLNHRSREVLKELMIVKILAWLQMLIQFSQRYQSCGWLPYGLKRAVHPISQEIDKTYKSNTPLTIAGNFKDTS